MHTIETILYKLVTKIVKTMNLIITKINYKDLEI